MKKLILVLSLIGITLSSFAQKEDFPEVSASYFALIVNDMNTSMDWYTNMLGFDVLNSRVFEEAGFKQANLNNGNSSLELIELNSALDPKATIPDYTAKTRLIGIFKIGFEADAFDDLIDHLELNNAQFHGNVVVNEESGKRMVILKDPDENRVQLFEK